MAGRSLGKPGHHASERLVFAPAPAHERAQADNAQCQGSIFIAYARATQTRARAIRRTCIDSIASGTRGSGTDRSGAR